MGFDRATLLRQYLGESIPDVGRDGNQGTDADTFFSNDAVKDLLTNFTGPAGTNLYLAAAEGWTRKAADVANLVTTAQSGSTRNLSDLHQQAIDQANYYWQLAYGRRNARLGKIVRPGTTVT